MSTRHVKLQPQNQMREVLEFFLDNEGTKYQLRAEMREAGLLFTLAVRNPSGSLYESGKADERDGDLESHDDGDGQSHFVRTFRYRTPDCKLDFGIEISESKLAWVTFSNSIDEKDGLRFKTDLPMERVYG